MFRQRRITVRFFTYHPTCGLGFNCFSPWSLLCSVQCCGSGTICHCGSSNRGIPGLSNGLLVRLSSLLLDSKGNCCYTYGSFRNRSRCCRWGFWHCCWFLDWRHRNRCFDIIGCAVRGSTWPWVWPRGPSRFGCGFICVKFWFGLGVCCHWLAIVFWIGSGCCTSRSSLWLGWGLFQCGFLRWQGYCISGLHGFHSNPIQFHSLLLKREYGCCLQSLGPHSPLERSVPLTLQRFCKNKDRKRTYETCHCQQEAIYYTGTPEQSGAVWKGLDTPWEPNKVNVDNGWITWSQVSLVNNTEKRSERRRKETDSTCCRLSSVWSCHSGYTQIP